MENIRPLMSMISNIINSSICVPYSQKQVKSGKEKKVQCYNTHSLVESPFLSPKNTTHLQQSFATPTTTDTSASQTLQEIFLCCLFPSHHIFCVSLSGTGALSKTDHASEQSPGIFELGLGRNSGPASFRLQRCNFGVLFVIVFRLMDCEINHVCQIPGYSFPIEKNVTGRIGLVARVKLFGKQAQQVLVPPGHFADRRTDHVLALVTNQDWEAVI